MSPVPTPYIQEAEEKLGTRLPDTLATFYRTVANGGPFSFLHDDWTLYPIADRTTQETIRLTWNDLVRQAALAESWPDFPPGGVPIADNGNGDILLLLPDPTHPGHLADLVFFWTPDTLIPHLACPSLHALLTPH